MMISRWLAAGPIFAGIAFGPTGPALAEGSAPTSGGFGQLPADVPPDSGYAMIMASDGSNGGVGWGRAATLAEAYAKATDACAKTTTLVCNVKARAAYPLCVARVVTSRPESETVGGVGPNADAAYADAVRRAAPRLPVTGQGLAFCTTDADIPHGFNR